VLDINWLATLFLPAALVGAILGVGLARYAVRVLLVPLIPELADTPYELIFRLRGLRLTTLTIGSTSVTIRGPVVLRTKSGQTPQDLGRTYPLSEIAAEIEGRVGTVKEPERKSMQNQQESGAA